MSDHPYEVSFLEIIPGGLAVIEHTYQAPACFECLLRNNPPSPLLKFVPIHLSKAIVGDALWYSGVRRNSGRRKLPAGAYNLYNDRSGVCEEQKHWPAHHR